MPLRGHNFSEICAADGCDEPAVDACVRCASRLCADHRPLDDMRCDACEHEFQMILLRQPERSTRIAGAPWVVAMVAAAIAFQVIGWWALAVIVAMVAVLSATTIYFAESPEPKPLTAADERKLRSAFLTERSKLLGSGDAPPES